jgi:hypothetical protein
MSDTDAPLWHPWLRINRVLRVMLHTHWSASPFCGPRRDADLLGCSGCPQRSWKIRRVERMAFEISCPTCASLGTERTIAGAMKLALAHAPQHSPVYIAGDGATFTIRHDGKPAIEVRFDDALPDLHHLARPWDES